MNNFILAAIATVFSANIASAQQVAESNGVLADPSGRTLYTFDKDAASKSNCNGGCATAWPPFFAKDGERVSAGFSVIARDDGAKQWAMNGKPLYYFAADVQPGDVKGDGQGGVWHVVRSAAQRSETKPAAAVRATDSYRPYSSY